MTFFIYLKVVRDNCQRFLIFSVSPSVFCQGNTEILKEGASEQLPVRIKATFPFTRFNSSVDTGRQTGE